MAKFEAHITFEKKDAEAVRNSLIENGGTIVNWKFSAFDADPVMGDKPYVYLTAYDTSEHQLLMRMNGAVTVAGKFGAHALREKIERIIYDTKTGVDEIVRTA